MPRRSRRIFEQRFKNPTRSVIQCQPPEVIHIVLNILFSEQSIHSFLAARNFTQTCKQFWDQFEPCLVDAWFENNMPAQEINQPRNARSANPICYKLRGGDSEIFRRYLDSLTTVPSHPQQVPLVCQYLKASVLGQNIKALNLLELGNDEADCLLLLLLPELERKHFRSFIKQLNFSILYMNDELAETLFWLCIEFSCLHLLLHAFENGLDVNHFLKPEIMSSLADADSDPSVSTKVARYLLANGARVYTDSFEELPMYKAILFKKFELLQVFLRHQEAHRILAIYGGELLSVAFEDEGISQIRPMLIQSPAMNCLRLFSAISLQLLNRITTKEYSAQRSCLGQAVHEAQAKDSTELEVILFVRFSHRPSLIRRLYELGERHSRQSGEA